jgi:uncharacterized protein YkwD
MSILFLNRMIGLSVVVILISCSPATYPTTTNTGNTNGGGTTTTTSGSSTTVNAGKLEKDILYNINQYRAKLGKPALTMIDAANKQANEHSANMASKKVAFSHDGFDTRIAKIIIEIGRVSNAAENVAYGQLDAKEVVDGWIKSSGHRKNIEGDFSLTGIGTARNSQGVIYFTQIFLRK